MVSSNDEFLQFDWASIYWNFQTYSEFGERRLLIIPNSDHTLETGMKDIYSSASTFIRSIAEGKTDRPSFEFSHDAQNKAITVTIPEDGPQPKEVYLRHAETFSSKRRDFRWMVLADDDGGCSSPWVDDGDICG